jgi:hypothetical protein
LGSGRILSVDRRDFGAYRWKHREPFENLLLDAEVPDPPANNSGTVTNRNPFAFNPSIPDGSSR